MKQRRTESSEKEIDWKCLLLPFSVCGSKKKQKIMYKSAKNAGELWRLHCYVTLQFLQFAVEIVFFSYLFVR